MPRKNYIEIADEFLTEANCAPELTQRQRLLLKKAAEIAEKYNELEKIVQKMNMLFVPKMLTLKANINGN